MNKNLEKFVVEKKLESAFSRWLEGLSAEDSEAVQYLIEALKPSANQLRSFVNLAREISKRDDTTIASELSTEPIHAILSNEKLSRNDKLSQLGSVLNARRFPFRANLEKNLEELKTRIRKQYDLNLEYPKDLEGSQLKISIVAKSTEEFREYARQIENFSKGEELKQVFSELLGEGEFDAF